MSQYLEIWHSWQLLPLTGFYYVIMLNIMLNIKFMTNECVSLWTLDSSGKEIGWVTLNPKRQRTCPENQFLNNSQSLPTKLPNERPATCCICYFIPIVSAKIKHLPLRYRKENLGNTVWKLKNKWRGNTKKKKKSPIFLLEFHVKEATLWILAMIYIW